MEAKESDDKHHLVVLELCDVGVESVAQQHAVLHHDDEVKQELSHQGGHVLEWLGPGEQQWIHSVGGGQCHYHNNMASNMQDII